MDEIPAHTQLHLHLAPLTNLFCLRHSILIREYTKFKACMLISAYESTHHSAWQVFSYYFIEFKYLQYLKLHTDTWKKRLEKWN